MGEHASLAHAEVALTLDIYRLAVPQIALVADEHGDNGGVGVRPQLAQPPFAVLEALAPRDVVHKQRADRAAIICGGDRAVALLAGGVPHLGLDGLAVVLDLPRRELHADRRLRVLAELVLGEA